MSNYDQNTTASGAVRTDFVIIDAGLRAHMLSTYNHMAAGVALTAVVAWLTYQLTGPELLQSPLMWVFILAPVVLVFFISARMTTAGVRKIDHQRPPTHNSWIELDQLGKRGPSRCSGLAATHQRAPIRRICRTLGSLDLG
jgi:FtsH-binding integral membrane protein